jgi:F0F1-type ATP synthase membrane subunit c/vacuolar-type H+-ATPase subunit K
MTGWSAAALTLWLLVGLASVGTWWPPLPGLRLGPDRPRTLRAAVALVLLLTGLVALFGALAPPLPPPWSWLAVGLAALGAAATGAVFTYGLLTLSDGSTAASARVQRTVLRGGAWIGVLERLAMLGTLLAGFPEGMAAVVAIKAFARYPELKSGQATGAIERFIIGTFASLGWAAVCAGVTRVLLRATLG